MRKVLIALFLGLISYFLFMFTLETVAPIFRGIGAIILSVIVMMAYFFICQFLLSRGNPHALFKDWPIMLALGAVGIVIPIFTDPNEGRGIFLTQRLGSLILCFVGILGGAFAASLAARRKARQQ
jgi:hypothetical protein